MIRGKHVVIETSSDQSNPYLSNVEDIVAVTEVSGKPKRGDIDYIPEHDEALNDHNKAIKAMAHGDDVLEGGRMNPYGKRVGRNGLFGSKAAQQTWNDIVLQGMMNDLAELQKLYDERDEIQARIDEMEEQVFTREELAAFKDLPEEERFEAKRQSMLEKLNNGEITQEFYDKWFEENSLKTAVEKQIEIEMELRRLEKALKNENLNDLSEIQRVLFEAHNGLLEERTNLATNIQGNEQFLNQLDQIKKTGNTSSSNAELIAMLESRPDLDTQFPENTSFEDKIDMARTAVNEQTLDLQREQVEVEEEIVKVETAQETLTRATPEEQTTERRARNG